MQHRQLAPATSFDPDALKVLTRAFDNAWSEISPRIDADPVVTEAARMSLASIILGLAAPPQPAPNGLKALAVAIFCARYRIELDGPSG
jgi:hypothetical protein